MKKRIIGVVMALTMAACLFAGCGSAPAAAPQAAATEEKKEEAPAEAAEEKAEAADSELAGKKVGLSFMDTSDPVIAELITRVRAAFDPQGIEVLVSDAGGDSSAQIDAVENFMNSGCSVIVIQAIDATAMSEEAKKAMDQGIKVVAYGIGIDNCDVWYKNDNTKTGTAIGEMAADWINSQLGGKAKVEVIGFPMVDVLIERADAIKNVLKEQCPEAEIVAEISAIDSESGYSQTETVLAANPDLNCIVSISDGPAVGAYEAAKAAGMEGENFAVFGSDLSNVAVEYINDDTSYKGSTDCDIKVGGDRIAEIALNLMKGEAQDEVVVMNVTKVTKDNIADYLE